MAIKIENMRNMVLKVARQADREESLRTSAALAKLYCARTAMEVIDDAIQIMGGLGYTDEARVSASGAMFAANVSVAARMKL